MIALKGTGCVARLPAWMPGALSLVLGTLLLAAETPRRIELAFKPVDIESAYQRRATSQDTLLASVQAHPDRTVVRPADTGAGLENPSMGWVCHHFDNSIRQYGPPLGPTYAGEGWPGLTVAYLRLAWSYLEPQDGVYDWSLVDDVAARYVKAGRQVAFRFTCYESEIPYATPKWLADAGCGGRWYKHGAGVVAGPEVKGATWEPDYDDPLFLDKLDRFLAEAARRYDGSPNVAFVAINDPDARLFDGPRHAGPMSDGRRNLAQKRS